MALTSIDQKQEKIPIQVLAPILLNFGLALSYIYFWFVAYDRDMFWKADFTAFYTGAKIIWTGQGRELYNLEVQKEYQSAILENYIAPDSLELGYISPPHIALAMGPLAALPRHEAYLLWTTGQVILLFWFLHVFWKATWDWNKISRLIGLSSSLGLHFMLLNFMLGTFTLAMLACMFEFYIAFRDNREKSAGVWLVLGSLKFQNMIFLGAALLGTRRWKVILAALAGAMVIFLVTSLVLDTRVWSDYINVLMFVSNLWGSVTVDPSSMYNLKGALTLIMGAEYGNVINLLSYTALGVGFLIVAWLWYRYCLFHKELLDLFLAFTVLFGLALSPHMNPQDGLLAVFPAVLFYRHLSKSNRPTKVYAVFVSLCPIVFLLTEFGLGAKLGFRVPFLALIVLLVWVTTEMARTLRLKSSFTTEIVYNKS